MNANTKDILIRALKTFVQTAGAYLIANLSGVDFFADDVGKAFWVGMMLSAGAAGISAAWNAIMSPHVSE